MTLSWLPPVLAQIADVAGLDAALAIARRHGGRRVSLPTRLHRGSWLVEAVGREAAQKILGHFGAGRLDIPLGQYGSYERLRRDLAARFADLEAGGAGAAKIAAELGVTERTVRNHRARRRARENSGQGSLF